MARTAMCHEWLDYRSGSEKTFEVMASALPGADLFALTRNPETPFDFGGRDTATTFLDRPWLRERRQLLLPLMPLAWRYASRQPYDLVVTSSHACAKGFWPARRALHLCYCYTPMRYVWLSSVDQRTRRTVLTSLPERLLRAWDRRSVKWVHEFAAISEAVRKRIQTFYGRPATVIYPPVETDFYTPAPDVPRTDTALAVSRMVGYKRLDLAIRACHALGYPLIVAGSGPEEQRLRALAGQLGARTTFVISPDDEQLRQLYRSARVVLFPAMEDFGIVPVEAQACGTPVVALGDGGSLETVVAGMTGELVGRGSSDLRDGLERTLARPIDAEACRRNAERFSRARFVREFRAWVAAAAAPRGLSVPATMLDAEGAT